MAVDAVFRAFEENHSTLIVLPITGKEKVKYLLQIQTDRFILCS
jgi:hypothetical protein